MTREQAWELFKQEGQEACVAPINIEYDDVQTDANATQGYYEYSGTELQEELIPVWIFEVDYYKDANLVLTGYAHIPSAITEPEQASSPWPPDGATSVSRDVVLSWTAGINAASHDVYFGTEGYAVKNATTSDPEYRTNQIATTYDAGVVESLQPGKTYFWRIDEVNDPDRWTGDVWRFTTSRPGQASSPRPTDGAAGVSREVDLSWTPGIYAAGHDVYLGTDFNDVNDATTSSSVYAGRQNLDANSYDPPGLLDANTTYYWRIDEVNDPCTWRGEVWRFTTGGPNFVYLGAEAVGDGTYRHSYKLSNIGGWVDLYDIETHFVYNPAWFSIYGPDDWNLEFIGLITRWQTGQSPCVVDAEQFGYHIYAGGPEVQEAYYTLTDVDHVVVADGYTSVPTEGLFPASAPQPSNGAVEVKPNVSLSWRPGCLASSHDVYLGTNWDDVNDADTTTASIYKGNQSSDEYVPGGLNLDSTYYWRIDEVNEAEVSSPWKGKVWSFTTANYRVVDDMESYDQFTNLISYTWWDGRWNNSGSWVELATYPDEPVHGGHQSMWYSYDNTGVLWSWDYYSEIIAETGGGLDQLQIGQDWTQGGVQALTLYFYGDPATQRSGTATTAKT
jgi:hypothetical protein